VPVGLSFEARRRFRGRVLVSFGEPVDVSSFLAVYRGEPAKALHSLTTAIQWAMEREVVHVERIDTAALARAVETLYRGELERELWEEPGLSGRRIELLPLSGSMADAVEHFREQDPSASSGSGSGYSVTTPDLPPTGSATRRVGLASRRRRSATGLHGHGRPSWVSRSSRTAGP